MFKFLKRKNNFFLNKTSEALTAVTAAAGHIKMDLLFFYMHTYIYVWLSECLLDYFVLYLSF